MQAWRIQVPILGLEVTPCWDRSGKRGSTGLCSDPGSLSFSKANFPRITEQPELEGTYKEHQSPVLWLLGRQAERGISFLRPVCWSGCFPHVPQVADINLCLFWVVFFPYFLVFFPFLESARLGLGSQQISFSPGPHPSGWICAYF